MKINHFVINPQILLARQNVFKTWGAWGWVIRRALVQKSGMSSDTVFWLCYRDGKAFHLEYVPFQTTLGLFTWQSATHLHLPPSIALSKTILGSSHSLPPQRGCPLPHLDRDRKPAGSSTSPSPSPSQSMTDVHWSVVLSLFRIHPQRLPEFYHHMDYSLLIYSLPLVLPHSNPFSTVTGGVAKNANMFTSLPCSPASHGSQAQCSP